MNKVPTVIVDALYYLIAEKYDAETKKATITAKEIIHRIPNIIGGVDGPILGGTSALFNATGWNIARSESLTDKNDVKFTFWGPTRDDFAVGTKVAIMHCTDTLPAGTAGMVSRLIENGNLPTKNFVAVDFSAHKKMLVQLVPANNLRKM